MLARFMISVVHSARRDIFREAEKKPIITLYCVVRHSSSPLSQERSPQSEPKQTKLDRVSRTCSHGY